MVLAKYARLVLATASGVALCFLVVLFVTASYPGARASLHSIRDFGACLVAAYALAWGVYFSWSRLDASSKRINCTLTTATLLFLFGLLEVPALLGVVDYERILSPGASALYMPEAWLSPGNQWDRELIYVHRPRRQFVAKLPGDLVLRLGIATDRRYDVDVRYDGRGFRNDHEIEQAPIVLIGDSFVEAALVSQPELLSTRLRERLHVEVANLGHAGYGPQQELVVLRRYGLGLRPRVVLWFLFEGNDFVDLLEYERVMTGTPTDSAAQHSFTSRSFTRNALLAVAGFAAAKPNRWFRRIWNLGQDAGQARKGACRLRAGEGNRAETVYFDSPACPSRREESASLDTLLGTLLQARDLAADRGAQLVVVYVPGKFRVLRDVCQFAPDSYANEWQLSDLPTRADAWCAAQGIPFINLTADLSAAAQQGQLVYFPDDQHWNGEGIRIAADTIGRYLETSRWMRDGAS